jgi:hypothetical protein
MPADAKRPSTAAEPKQWKGQSSYAGAKSGANKAGTDRVAAASQPPRPVPKVQGSYGGASPDRGKAPQVGYAGAQQGRAKAPSSGKVDRGYAQPQARPEAKPQQMPKPQAKPAARPAPMPQARPQKPTAMSGAGGSGKADRAASQRGKQNRR